MRLLFIRWDLRKKKLNALKRDVALQRLYTKIYTFNQQRPLFTPPF